jgi:hypothetical protein
LRDGLRRLFGHGRCSRCFDLWRLDRRWLLGHGRLLRRERPLGNGRVGTFTLCAPPFALQAIALALLRRAFVRVL